MLSVGLTAGSIASAQIGLSLVVQADGASPIWAANAFMAAALLLLPRAWALGVVAACFLGEVALAGSGPNLLLGAALSVINVGEAFIVAALARKACGRTVRLTNFGRVWRLLAFAIVPAVAVSAMRCNRVEFSSPPNISIIRNLEIPKVGPCALSRC